MRKYYCRKMGNKIGARFFAPQSFRKPSGLEEAFSYHEELLTMAGTKGRNEGSGHGRADIHDYA